jgi:hypothetical protein
MADNKGSRENSVYYYNITTQSAGTGTTTGTVIDMGGNLQAKGVEAILALGDCANTSIIKIKAYEGAASGTQTTSLGTVTFTASATSADDKLMVLDVSEVTKRYVRFDVVVATANATIEALVARQYNVREMPTSGTGGSVVAGATV